MAPSKAKNKECDENRDSEVTELLKTILNSDAFKTAFSEIIKSETKELYETIINLRNEVSALRESNKDLIRLLTADGEFLNKPGTKNAQYSENTPTTNNWVTVKPKVAQSDKKHTADKAKETPASTSGEKTTQPIKMSQTKTDQTAAHNQYINSGGANIRSQRNGHKNKPKVLYGSGTQTSTKSGFTAVSRKTWIYIGRATPGTSENSIRDLLAEKFPQSNFIIEKLPKWKNGVTESFKIGADYELHDEIFISDNWPQGTLIKRYKFFRNEN